MRKLAISIVLMGWAAICSTVRASGPGTTGGNVLSIGVGARAIAMGEAYTAQADDASSLYWNPAGIALLNQSQASFIYNQFLQDQSYSHAAVAMPLEYGGLGASLSYLSFGGIDGYDKDGNPTGNVNAYSSVGTLGAACLGESWSAGFNVKGVQASLADVKAAGFAADVGVNVIYPREVMGGTLRFGVAERNLGTGLKFIDQTDPFPSQWRVGLAAVQMMDRKLNLSMDYGQERGYSSALYGGGEYWAFPIFALRAGYAGSKAEGSGLRVGAGFRMKSFSLDYAYSDYGELGLTHRYELSYYFGPIRPLLSPEERQIYRRAREAMRRERYGEAVLLFDSLINLEPRYRPFKRWIKLAMKGLERQETLAKSHTNFQYTDRLTTGHYPGQDDGVDWQEMEQLLAIGDNETQSAAKVLAPGQLGETK